MAVELASGYISLVPSTKNIGASIAREMGAPIEQAAHQTSSRVGSIFGKLAAVVGGAFAVKAGVDMFRGFIDAAEESRKVGAQSAAVIKSTGGAAKITAGQMGDLAAAIAAKTGVDDEAIQSGENLLATFTNIQNRAGKGNDIFSQSTQTLVDMAAAMGGDVSSNAIQLGKALNDPVAGISALTRVGVTFSDEQKKTIKAMVATGDVAGAQKVILAELNKEFGGSAAAQATAGKKLSVIWGNIQEQLGGVLLPLVDKGATWIGERLPGAFSRAGAVLGPIVRTLGLGLSALVAAFREGDVTSDGFVGVMERIGVALRSAIPTFKTIADFVKNNLTVVLVGLAAVVLLLISPWALVIAALIAAYVKFSWFRTGVQAVVDFFTNVLIPAVAAVASFIITQIGHLVDWWRRNWNDIETIVTNAAIGIQMVVAAVVEVVAFIWKNAGEHIVAIVKAAWDQIRLVIDTAVRIIRDIVTVFIAVLSGDWGKAWNALIDIPKAAFDLIVGTVKTYLTIIWHAVQGGLDLVVALWDAAFGGIKGIVEGALRFVLDKFLGYVEPFVTGAAAAFGWIPKLGDKLHDAADQFRQFRDQVNASLGGIHDKDINVRIVGGQAGVGTQLRASGGPVTAGNPYWVGETGRPELFVPDMNGRILTERQVANASSASMPPQGVTRVQNLYLTVREDDKPDVIEQFRRMELLATP